jgi:hypothetical protein
MIDVRLSNGDERIDVADQGDDEIENSVLARGGISPFPAFCRCYGPLERFRLAILTFFPNKLQLQESRQCYGIRRARVTTPGRARGKFPKSPERTHLRSEVGGGSLWRVGRAGRRWQRGRC